MSSQKQPQKQPGAAGGRQKQVKFAGLSLSSADVPESSTTKAVSKSSTTKAVSKSSTTKSAVAVERPATPMLTEAQSLAADWRVHNKNARGRFASPRKSRQVVHNIESTRVELESRRTSILEFLESPENDEHDARELIETMEELDDANGKLADDDELANMYELQKAIAALPRNRRAFAQVDGRNWALAERGDGIECSMEQLIEECQKLGPESGPPAQEQVDQLIKARGDLEKRYLKLQEDLEEQLLVVRQWHGDKFVDETLLDPLDDLDLTMKRIEIGSRQIRVPKGDKKGKGKQRMSSQQPAPRPSLLGSKKGKAAEEDDPSDLEARVEKLIKRCSDWREEWRQVAEDKDQPQHHLIGGGNEKNLEAEKLKLQSDVRDLKETLERERGVIAGHRLLYRANDFLLEDLTHDRRASFDKKDFRLRSWTDMPTVDELVVLKYKRREYTQATIIQLLSDQDHLRLAANVFLAQLRRNPAIEAHDRRVARHPLRLFKIQDLANSDAQAFDFKIKRLVCGPPAWKNDSARRDSQPRPSTETLLIIARLMMTQSILVDKLCEEIGLVKAADEIPEKQKSIRAKQSIPVDGHARRYATEAYWGLSLEFPDSDFTFGKS
ncbi:hypothetical protein LTR09_007894 [Extremus antarcticus]|uniref:Uncharacterized protein n=1 Tax=Extremus antarcticus TaxID=702011 RepID=A0AAJ0G796_9PEZI|nr:hypothetical protein LTR09_007894 [Extremus antarcticus]